MKRGIQQPGGILTLGIAVLCLAAGVVDVVKIGSIEAVGAAFAFFAAGLWLGELFK